MKIALLTTIATTSLFAASIALACGGDKTTLTKLTVEEAKKAQPVFVDVNNRDTRSRYGVIPGAVLLTSHDEFDANQELPKNKTEKLVFYCANEYCGASKAAASRAMAAGFENVAILPAGIQGWKEAGMQTATFKETKATPAPKTS